VAPPLKKIYLPRCTGSNYFQPGRFPRAGFISTYNPAIKMFDLKRICMLTLVLTTALLSSPVFSEEKHPFEVNGKPVPETVATVNGTKLSGALLEREWIAFTLMASRKEDGLAPEDREKVIRHLLIDAIDKELLYQEARKLGIRIKPEVINAELTRIESQFPSKELFLSALSRQQLTLDTLKHNMELQLSEEELIRMKIAPEVHVEDKAVQDYYQKNDAQFSKPEAYRVSHIYVGTTNPDQEGKADSPEDQEKADRLMAWIALDAKNKINKIYKELKSGKDFTTLVKEYSEDESTRDKGGDLGELYLEHTLPEIAKVMKALKVNQTSEIIKTSLGYHIIKLTGKTPSHKTPLQEVKSDILNYLMKEETRKMRKDYVSRLREKADIKIFL